MSGWLVEPLRQCPRCLAVIPVAVLPADAWGNRAVEALPTQGVTLYVRRPPNCPACGYYAGGTLERIAR